MLKRGPKPYRGLYVGAAELSELLGCCPHTIRNWADRGVFAPPQIIGGRRVWPLEVVHIIAGAKLASPLPEPEVK
jgi:hypothetical protein